MAIEINIVGTASNTATVVVPGNTTEPVDVTVSYTGTADDALLIGCACDEQPLSTITSPQVTDTLGNAYSLIQSDIPPYPSSGGALFVSSRIIGGANTIKFQVSIVNSDSLSQSFVVSITVCELSGAASSATITSGIVQLTGPADFAITLTNAAGISVKTDAGTQAESTFIVADLKILGTDFFVAMASPGSNISSPWALTVTGASFGYTNQVTANDPISGHNTLFFYTQTTPVPISPVPSPPAKGPGPAWLVTYELSGSPATGGYYDRTTYLLTGGGDQHSFNLQARQRGQASYRLVHDPDNPQSMPGSYRPTIGGPIYLWDEDAVNGWTLVFSGLIQDYTIIQNGNGGSFFLDVNAVSFESVFDTVYCDGYDLFLNQTCGAILTALFNKYESGCPVILGTISAGATIAQFNPQKGDKLSDIFQQLAITSEFTWGVDPQTSSLYFCTPSTVAAPFVIDSVHSLWDTISLKLDGADYRNRQAVKLSFDAFEHSKEYFIGSGQQTFTLMRPVQQVTNAYVTLSTPNTATGSFSGQPSAGDTVTIGPASGAWQANHIYGLGGVIIFTGFVFKVTTAGTSGGSIPNFAAFTTLGDTVSDFSVIWTCQGPSGLGTGTQTYTFVSTIDNTQFGEVLIGATDSDTAQNLVDAINATVSRGGVQLRGVTFSLPTWENSQVNAISLSGTGFTVQQKSAGSGWVATVSTTSSAFSWTTGAESWQPNTFYGVGQLIAEGGFMQQVTSGLLIIGGESGSSAPSWNNTTGGTTTDNQLTWTCRGAQPTGSSVQTSGGTSPQGSVGPNEGATIEIQVYAAGTSTAAPGLAYTQGSDVVTLATPLNSGTNLNVEYTRVDGNIIEVEDTALVTALAFVTGGTGKYQQMTDQSNQGLISTSAAAGLQLAQQALAAFDVVPSELKVEIYEPGILPGQIATLSLTGPLSLFNGDYYIEEVSGQFIPTHTPEPFLGDSEEPWIGHYRYTLRLIDVAQIQSYMDFWENNLSGGTGGGSGAALVATSGGAMAPQGLTIPQKYSTTFTSVTSVTVTHDLNTTAVFIQVFDASGNAVIPENIAVTSANVVTLTFGASFSGSVVVIG